MAGVRDPLQAALGSAIRIGFFREFTPLRADPRYAKIRRATNLEGVPSVPVTP
jgi:hypothetical protein